MSAGWGSRGRAVAGMMVAKNAAIMVAKNAAIMVAKNAAMHRSGR